MRQIKFRAWDKDEKRWFSNFYLSPKGQLLEKDMGLSGLSPIPTDMVELMQYTGRHDKNGKEIYEGDIVKVWHYRDEDAPELDDTTIHEVVWGGDGEYPAFDLKPDLTDDMNDLAYMVSGGFDDDIPHHEVIGNIYENPELLK